MNEEMVMTEKEKREKGASADRTLLITGSLLLVALIVGAIAGGLFTSSDQSASVIEDEEHLHIETEPDSDIPSEYGVIPERVAFTERSGRRIELGDFRGEAWVASFIFTRCQGTCPIMTAALKELQQELDAQGTPLRLVSFTVDPEHDSPEKLAEYAEEYEADDRWLFLSAPDSVVQPLAIETFNLAIAEGTDPKEPIIHSSRFILIDKSGTIRGYFDGMTPKGRKSLLKTVRQLEDLNEL